MGQPLYCSAANAGMWGERPGWWIHPLHVTQQYLLASMAARLSSTGIFHHSLLPHIPLIIPPQSTAALTLGLLHNPQTPASSFCTFQGTCILVWDMYGCSKDCLILIPFRLPQMSCFTLNLKCFSSDSVAPMGGIGPLLRFPHLLSSGPILLTLLFFPIVPSSYQVLHGSVSSGQVRYSCLLSAGFLHASVWRCIPDVSMERDGLRIHLLILHLVLFPHCIF